MKSEVDRELAKLEERRAEQVREPTTERPKGKVWPTVKRIARDLALRRVSTKR